MASVFRELATYNCMSNVGKKINSFIDVVYSAQVFKRKDIFLNPVNRSVTLLFNQAKELYPLIMVTWE